jgi:orotate phosphoribosyltransferase
MLKKLSNLELESKNKRYKLSWKNFEKAGEIIGLAIKKKYSTRKACLLGVARGGLPLLTIVSHYSGIRDISVVQLQMTNSDNPYDYGEVRELLYGIRFDFDNFIILEDIIYKGNSSGKVIKYLNSLHKNILEIYSIFVDEDFNYNQDNFKKINVNYVYSIIKDYWVLFPWEKNGE